MNSIFVASLVHDATSRVFPAMNSTHKDFLFCSPTYKRAHKLSSFCIAFACLACTEFNICGQPFSRCHVACLQVAGTLYFVPTPAISTLATTTTADQQQYQHQKSFVGHRNHKDEKAMRGSAKQHQDRGKCSLHPSGAGISDSRPPFHQVPSFHRGLAHRLAVMHGVLWSTARRGAGALARRRRRFECEEVRGRLPPIGRLPLAFEHRHLLVVRLLEGPGEVAVPANREATHIYHMRT